MYQIWQIGKIECFASILRKGLIHRTLAKTSCHHLLWLFAFQSCVEHMLHFIRRLLASYPWKHFWSSMSLESSHSLSHTTLTMKSHIKYKVQKIEHNYNEIWHGIKLTQISCKSQLYNLPLWLFRDNTPKTDSRLKREFGNSGKTHSHLI